MEYLKKLYLKSIGIDCLPDTVRGEQHVDVDAGNDQETLEQLLAEIGDCQLCKLSEGRTRLVFGVGSPRADLVFVGEAPGRDEDVQGEPFVGKAGQMLTRIISGMGLERNDVYICNVIKCRPPENRDPRPEEIATCEPFLIKQLKIIKPRAICALGTFASQTLLNSEERISRLRGRFHDYYGIPIMPTYHPSYLLRNPHAKRDVWEDIKMVMELLDLPLPGYDNS